MTTFVERRLHDYAEEYFVSEMVVGCTFIAQANFNPLHSTSFFFSSLFHLPLNRNPLVGTTMSSPPRIPLPIFNNPSLSGSSDYNHSPPATLPATPSGTHRRPIPLAAASIAESYAQSFAQWAPRPGLGNIVAFSMTSMPSIHDPLRWVLTHLRFLTVFR